MIDTLDCYCEVKTKSQYISKNFHSLTNEWVLFHGIQTTHLSNDVINYDPFLFNIDSVYKIQKMHIGIFDSNHMYKMHKDSDRILAINMLLTEHNNSHCLFGGSDSFDKTPKTEIVELKYKVDTFYIFNTQVPHSIINFDKPRYLLTIQMIDGITYEQVRDYVIANNL
jgi:hypothetical protein